MKILDIAAHCPTERKPGFFGGAEISRRLFHNVFMQGGHQVIAVRGDSEDRTEELDLGRRVLTLRFPSETPPQEVGRLSAPKRILWHARDDFNPDIEDRFGHILDDEKPDVVFTGNLSGFSSAVWAAAAQRGLPIVHYLHDFYLTCHRSVRYRQDRHCDRSCTSCSFLTVRRRRATELVHCVIGNSKYTLDLHTALQLFPNASTFVQHPYVHEEPQSANANGAGPGKRPRLGFLGRISPEKGIEQLMQARSRMKTQTDLLIAGQQDPAARASVGVSGSDPGVRFLGLMDPSEFFRQIDLLVVPSLWNEPFGRVVVEAWSHGVPAAVATRGGLAQLVPAAWQFDPQDVSAFALRLDEICSSTTLLREEATRARAAAASFTPEAMLATFEAAFEQAKVRAGQMC